MMGWEALGELLITKNMRRLNVTRKMRGQMITQKQP